MKKSNRVANKIATAIVRMMTITSDCLCLDKKATMAFRRGGLLCSNSFLYLIRDLNGRICISGREFENTPLSELSVESLRIVKRMAEFEIKNYTYWHKL